MPEISRFYGIVITLSGELLAGSLPPRALALVRTWAREHPGELADDWERAERGEPLVPIEPLD